ncbi:MAG: hypothetical protein AAGC55_30195, partial [Myxococcota bacterium]
MLLACSPSPDEGLIVDQQERGIHMFDQLGFIEAQVYMGDQRYLHSIAKPDTAIQLNFADDRQYRFATTRLKMAGKDTRNSPYLFELIEQRRAELLAKGYGPGLLPKSEYTGLVGLAEGEREEMHYIETASLGETTLEENDGIGSASTTFPGETYYTYIDANFTTDTGYPIGPGSYAYEYGTGQNINVSTTGDPSLTGSTEFNVTSLKYESTDAGFVSSYTYTTLGNKSGGAALGPPQLSAPNILAPVDHKFDDNLISVCLNRTWTQDCDYDLTGNTHSVKMPLMGEITVQSGHELDT